MAALPSALSGGVVDSFAYVTIRDRLPVILTKAIDGLHRQRKDIAAAAGRDVAEEIKAVLGELSELRYRMATNKALLPIDDPGSPDAEAWQRALAVGEGQELRWFAAPWLLVECYMYRRVAAAFHRQAHLARWDPFGESKREAFVASLPAMEALVGYLYSQSSGSPGCKPRAVVLRCLLQTALWGNRCDLSISQGVVAAAAADSPLEQVARLQGNILASDLDAAVDVVAGTEGGEVTLVLDNAGMELVADLVLADFLLSSRLAAKVHLQGKALPWFVSDVTAQDLAWTLERLRASESLNLSRLGQSITAHLSQGHLTAAYDPFWTLPHPYCEMAAAAPELHAQLATQKLAIFKGDLNYRKLVSDLDWPRTAGFGEALRGFGPCPVLSLRTLKAELCVGLKDGQSEEMTRTTGGKDWFLTGEFAVAQLHVPAPKQ